jgi:lipoprotein-releasing system ATP-binding protein
MNGIHVKVQSLSKRYHKGDTEIRVLDKLDLELQAGEMVSVVGPSGTGKSTLLHMLGLLDRPTEGTVCLDGVDIYGRRNVDIDRLRNRRVGFVFQSHNLLTERTALGNVMVPVRLAGGSPALAERRAEALLCAVGLGHRLHHQPGELSGGEQQRVALARALVMGPGLVLADEPTGNLDPATAEGVFDLMLSLNEQLGSTLVVVTHSLDLSRRFARRLDLANGQLQEV